MACVPQIAMLGHGSASLSTGWVYMGTHHQCSRVVPGPSFGWKDKLPDPESAGMRITRVSRRETVIDPANPLRRHLHMDALDVRQIFLGGG